MNYQERQTTDNNLEASKYKLLREMIIFCRDASDELCLNKDCDRCYTNQKIKTLKEDLIL